MVSSVGFKVHWILILNDEQTSGKLRNMVAEAEVS